MCSEQLQWEAGAKKITPGETSCIQSSVRVMLPPSRPTWQRYPWAGCLHCSHPRSSVCHPDASTARPGTGMKAALRAARQQLLTHAVPGSGSPPTNARLSSMEQEEESCFFKGQLVAPGPPSLGDAYHRGRTPPSARHEAGPTACPSAGLLFQPEATTSKIEERR